MAELPNRIWVVGPCGSGKTHVADLLARRRGVDAVHVDELHHLPGWRERPREELRALLDAATSGPAWIVDGNYSKAAADFRRRAELVIWLDLSFPVTFLRVLRRTFRRSLTGELCCNGNRESLREAFFGRESILLWAITHHGSTRSTYAQELSDQRHVRLRSRREVAEFLAGIAPVNRNGPDARASGPQRT